MIRVGILGTGFGKVHANIYKKLPDVEIAGIFGRTAETLQELKNEFNIPVTTKIDELITDPSIDVIDVCLPTALHKDAVTHALQQNKHVLCETPVCYTMEDAHAMKCAAERSSKQVFVDLFFKFSDPHRYAIETIQSESLGKPRMVTCYQMTPPHWGNMGVNQLIQDFMLHNFDFLIELFGMPLEVSTKGVVTKNAHVVSTLHYPEGMAVVESSTMLPWTFPFSLGFTIICEQGTLTFEGRFGENTIQNMSVYTHDTQKTITLPGRDDYEETIKHVLQCLSTRTPSSLLSLDAAIQSLTIANATKESFACQQPVTVT